jgi:hypothetical protein
MRYTLLIVLAAAGCGSASPPQTAAKTDSVAPVHENRIIAGMHTAKTAKDEITAEQDAHTAEMEAQVRAAGDTGGTP